MVIEKQKKRRTKTTNFYVGEFLNYKEISK